jgi:hypothetical protein
MDFKSLISKIESIDGKINTPKAPELPKSVQLNEGAQLRVLSGQTTYVSEAKKKKDEEVKEADDMKVGDKKNIATGTVEKTKTGIVHKSSTAYGGSEEKEADDEDDKPAAKKGMSDKQAKYFGKKTESKMMPKDKKKTVKESVEQKLSFKQMVQLVQESGGQQQIDAVDKALFTWAERVAHNKLGEGMKADLYAGLVYERNGGEFEMYDVLSETQK